MSKVLVDRELLPCPFCGETLRVNNANLAVHSRDSDCLLRQQPVVVDDPAQVDRWNRRAQPAEAEGVEVVAYVGRQARMTTEGWENGEEYLVFADQASDADKRYDVPLMTVAQHLAALAAVTAERDRLREEVTEMDDLRDKLSGLLSKTAVALRGPEPELTRYGYADIPLRVKTVIDERDQLRAEVETLRKVIRAALYYVPEHKHDLRELISAAMAAKEA